MALELHIAGPGLDVRRRLEPGEPALILGRDADCAVCLPDPERNVSRRHLSVWNDGDELHFHVLSVVNGVATSAGELPPGARGVLAAGEVLALSAFRLQAAPLASVDAADSPAAGAPVDMIDPWAQLQHDAEQMPTVPVAAGAEEDPFGDWGFQSTFGPGAPGGTLRADALLPATDLGPFFAGLGLPHGPSSLTRGELESIGRLTRAAVQALLQATQAAGEGRATVRSEDRTMLEPRELNPLRLEAPLQAKLDYLFGGAAAAAGLLPQERALAQVAAELLAHQQAMGEAARAALARVLAEFDPEALKQRLLGSGPRLFESARAWDAFVRDYAERRGQGEAWIAQLLARHFGPAYAAALSRVKRDTAPPARG